MSVRIRLRRVGKRNQPSYRIVVADKRSPRDGRFIEKIGFYNPLTEPSIVEVNEARALHWLSVGASPSEAVERILGWSGTRDRFQRWRDGEDIDALIAEAEEAAAQAAPIDPRTRRPEIIDARLNPNRPAPVVEEEAEEEVYEDEIEDYVEDAIVEDEVMEEEYVEDEEIVEDVVDEAEELVEDVVEDVEETVEDVVDEVEDDVEDVVEDVEEELEVEELVDYSDEEEVEADDDVEETDEDEED